MIRLLSFDLDDTLWPCQPVILRAERKAHAWLCRWTPRLAGYGLEELRQQRLQWMQAHPTQAHDLTQARLQPLRQLMRRHGYHPAFADASVVVFRYWRNRIEPYADVLPALQRLRQHFELAALTNGNVVLEQTPLQGLFHYFISAEKVGAAKPHPAMFQALLAASGLAPEQIVHIGDDIVRDIEPALRLGMHAIWIRRHVAMAGHLPKVCEIAVPRIESLSELPKALQTFASRDNHE